MGAVLINFMILFDMPPRPSLNFLRMLFFFLFIYRVSVEFIVVYRIIDFESLNRCLQYILIIFLGEF